MKYLVLLLLILSLPIFIFKLGDSSLVSWDEGWFASIAKNIIKSGEVTKLYPPSRNTESVSSRIRAKSFSLRRDFAPDEAWGEDIPSVSLWELHWNGSQFVDHPPLGFWLMAGSFKLLGVNEFSARLPSALFGVASLFAIYLLGKELFNSRVGIFSMVGLISSPWFVFRARSGNLDIFLVFFFILSFYLALKYLKDKKYGIFLGVALACLFLTKTLVGFTIVPVILYLFWKEKKLTLAYLSTPLLIGFIPFLIWFLIQSVTYNGFISRFLFIGVPGIKVATSYVDNLKLFKDYLHSGVGRWFWPGVASLAVLPFLKQKRAYILPLFFVFFALPFIFSSKGHIWHLIPLHPILILSFLGTGYVLAYKFTGRKILSVFAVFLATFLISFPQIRQNWYNFIDIPAFVSDEAILSREAGKYPYKFYIDDDFDPVAAFYSDKNVEQILEGDLSGIFAKKESFVLITYQWRLEQAKIKPAEYRIVKMDRDKILVARE